jgi:hypothetical protein
VVIDLQHRGDHAGERHARADRQIDAADEDHERHAHRHDHERRDLLEQVGEVALGQEHAARLRQRREQRPQRQQHQQHDARVELEHRGEAAAAVRAGRGFRRRRGAERNVGLCVRGHRFVRFDAFVSSFVLPPAA